MQEYESNNGSLQLIELHLKYNIIPYCSYSLLQKMFYQNRKSEVINQLYLCFLNLDSYGQNSH